MELAWEEITDGKHPLSRPTIEWKDNVKLDLRFLNIDRAIELVINLSTDCEISNEPPLVRIAEKRETPPSLF